MALYADCLLPYLIHAAMRQDRFTPYRRRVAAAAAGRVLEIGIGSGLNLPLYPPAVSQVVGIDPSARLLALAHSRAGVRPPVNLIAGSAECVPLADRSVDTIVSTWTLCSIPDARRALREMRRVLKPGGRLLFVEHGQAPDLKVRRWQDRLTPAWKHLAGGCHLNRPIKQLIEDAGFRIASLEHSYIDGPRPMTCTYEGDAR